MEFKKLEIEQESGWLKRVLGSRQIKRSIIATAIGAVAGFLFFYISEGRHQEMILAGEVVKSIIIGGFFGLFITNSPCARGRC